MSHAAYAACCVEKLCGLRTYVADNIGYGFCRQLRVHDESKCVCDDRAYRDKILHRVVLHLRHGRGYGNLRSCGHKEGVSIRFGMCDGLCRNGAIGPDLVLYVKRFPEYFTESLSENAREGDGAPACSIRHDDPDGGFRPLP